MKVSPTCIKCLNPNAIVCLRMTGSEDATDVDFKCESCKEEFTASDVQNMITAIESGWKKTLTWLASMPEE